MANKFASADGNWSTMTWWTTSGGPTTTTAPGAGDNADMNGHAVTIDQAVTCTAIVGSGTVSVSGDRTITANLGASGDSWTCTLNGSNQAVTVVGNIIGPNTANPRILVSGATTTLNVTGGSTGNANNGAGISQSNGTVTISGTLITGGNTTSPGLSQSGGVSTLAASITSGNKPALIVNGGTCTLNNNATTAFGNNWTIRVFGGTLIVNGNVTNGAGSSWNNVCMTIDCEGGTVTVNGNVTGGSAANGHYGINLASGTVSVNGTVTGGSNSNTNLTINPYGVLQIGGTLTITGNLVDTSQCDAVGRGSGTFNYTPTNSQTATVGGKVLYPTAGKMMFNPGMSGGMN